MRWKALAEIYTMHFFAPVSNIKIFVKTFFGKFARFWLILREFLTLGTIFWNLQYFNSSVGTNCSNASIVDVHGDSVFKLFA